MGTAQAVVLVHQERQVPIPKAYMAPSKLSRSEHSTFALLFVGYVAYYLTRKNITVASISMKDLGLLSVAQIGYLSSLGTLFYGIGKFTNGLLADRIGGKNAFLLGMAGSVVSTCLFGSASSYPAYLITWSLNSFFLSMGWSGLIKVMAYWFGDTRRGTVLGWMSLNYQMGSTVAKAFTTFLMGFPLLVWRGLFFVPALVLFLMAVVILFFLHERPDEQRLGTPMQEPPEPARPQARSHEASGPDGDNRWPSWLGLFKHSSFLLILWASAALTLIRTFFDDFPALWLSVSGLDHRAAGYISALFTVGGMGGTVVVGYLSDRLGKGNRAPFMSASGLLLGILLLSSGHFPKDSIPFSALFFTLTGVFIYGIYSILGGVAAIDFGGRAAPSTVAGIIDGVGYLAAAGAGLLVARMKGVAGWEGVVQGFALLTILVSVSLLPLWRRYPRRSPLEHEERLAGVCGPRPLPGVS